MSSSGKIIEIKNLTVGYKKGKVGISVMKFPDITVDKGDFIAITGPNGIGKSTFIKSLIHLIPVLEGQISILGKPVQAYSRIELASLLSYVSTEILHIPQFTVRDLVTFGRYPYTNWIGKMQTEDITIVNEAIEMLELKHLAGKYIDEISDGERQRAMIARAIAQKTDIIILDEPTAFLDLPHKHEIIYLLGQFSRKFKKTILFSTHDIGIALKETDKLWILSDSGFYQGAPEDLVLEGVFSKVFDTSTVSFDYRKGEFRVKRKTTPFFFITGKNTLVYWTRIALEKDGFTILEKPTDNSAHLTIDTNSDGNHWHLSYNQKQENFDSIRDLRKYIRSNFSDRI